MNVVPGCALHIGFRAGGVDVVPAVVGYADVAEDGVYIVPLAGASVDVDRFGDISRSLVSADVLGKHLVIQIAVAALHHFNVCRKFHVGNVAEAVFTVVHALACYPLVPAVHRYDLRLHGGVEHGVPRALEEGAGIDGIGIVVGVGVYVVATPPVVQPSRQREGEGQHGV